MKKLEDRKEWLYLLQAKSFLSLILDLLLMKVKNFFYSYKNITIGIVNADNCLTLYYNERKPCCKITIFDRLKLKI